MPMFRALSVLISLILGLALVSCSSSDNNNPPAPVPTPPAPRPLVEESSPHIPVFGSFLAEENQAGILYAKFRITEEGTKLIELVYNLQADWGMIISEEDLEFPGPINQFQVFGSKRVETPETSYELQFTATNENQLAYNLLVSQESGEPVRVTGKLNKKTDEEILTYFSNLEGLSETEMSQLSALNLYDLPPAEPEEESTPVVENNGNSKTLDSGNVLIPVTTANFGNAIAFKGCLKRLSLSEIKDLREDNPWNIFTPVSYAPLKYDLALMGTDFENPETTDSVPIGVAHLTLVDYYNHGNNQLMPGRVTVESISLPDSLTEQDLDLTTYMASQLVFCPESQ